MLTAVSFQTSLNDACNTLQRRAVKTLSSEEQQFVANLRAFPHLIVLFFKISIVSASCVRIRKP
jgi:hypothetical protein